MTGDYDQGYVWLTEREAIAVEMALDRFRDVSAPGYAEAARSGRVKVTQMLQRHWPISSGRWKRMPGGSPFPPKKARYEAAMHALEPKSGDGGNRTHALVPPSKPRRLQGE